LFILAMFTWGRNNRIWSLSSLYPFIPSKHYYSQRINIHKLIFMIVIIWYHISSITKIPFILLNRRFYFSNLQCIMKDCSCWLNFEGMIRTYDGIPPSSLRGPIYFQHMIRECRAKYDFIIRWDRLKEKSEKPKRSNINKTWTKQSNIKLINSWANSLTYF